MEEINNVISSNNSRFSNAPWFYILAKCIYNK